MDADNYEWLTGKIISAYTPKEAAVFIHASGSFGSH
jgi:hypothetical protein